MIITIIKIVLNTIYTFSKEKRTNVKLFTKSGTLVSAWTHALTTLETCVVPTQIFLEFFPVSLKEKLITFIMCLRYNVLFHVRISKYFWISKVGFQGIL